MKKLKPCPFCGVIPRIQICDDEGNFKSIDYLDDPYSGISYAICHEDNNNNNKCPIITEKYEPLGIWLYDTEEEAIDTWNRRIKL